LIYPGKVTKIEDVSSYTTAKRCKNTQKGYTKRKEKS